VTFVKYKGGILERYQLILEYDKMIYVSVGSDEMNIEIKHKFRLFFGLDSNIYYFQA